MIYKLLQVYKILLTTTLRTITQYHITAQFHPTTLLSSSDDHQATSNVQDPDRQGCWTIKAQAQPQDKNQSIEGTISNDNYISHDDSLATVILVTITDTVMTSMDIGSNATQRFKVNKLIRVTQSTSSPFILTHKDTDDTHILTISVWPEAEDQSHTNFGK